MFAHDRGWVKRLVEAVRSGLTAEAAVDRVRAEHRVRLMKTDDPYLRARLHDLEELANRLLQHLQGKGFHKLLLPENAILIARNASPAELLDFDRTKLKGLALPKRFQTKPVQKQPLPEHQHLQRQWYGRQYLRIKWQKAACQSLF